MITGWMFLILSYCAYSDYKEHKIYNLVTIPTIFLGILLNTVEYGYDGLFSSLLTILILFALFILPACLGWIGFGDLKLLVAFGSMMGTAYVFSILFLSSLLAIPYIGYRWFKKRQNQTILFGIFLWIAMLVFELLRWIILGVL